MEPTSPDKFSRTFVQDTLIEVWREILRYQTIPMNRSFFDLGGDSLSAMLCLSRIRRRFGIQMGLEDLLADNATLPFLTEAILRALSCDAS